MQRDTLTEPQQAPIDVRLQLQESIFHESQVHDTGFDIVIDGTITEAVHSRRIEQCTNQVLQAVDESYQTIASQIDGEPDNLAFITSHALDQCLQKAIQAKSENKQEDVLHNLQTAILLTAMGSVDDEHKAILHTVESGLAVDLIQAVSPLRDVHIRNPSNAWDINPATRAIVSYDALLELATGYADIEQALEPDSQPHISNSDLRQQQLNALNPDEALALAKHQANNIGNLDAAAHTALLSLKKIENNPYSARDISLSESLIDVHDIVSAADSRSSSDTRTEQFNQAMKKLLGHRSPNFNYRTNDALCSELDYAVVELVIVGRADIAAKLISGGGGDGHVEQGGHGSFSHWATALAQKYDVSADDILSQIESIHQQKRKALTTGLIERDIDLGLIGIIAHSAPVPELSLELDKNQWQELQKLDFRFLTENVIKRYDIARASSLLQYVDLTLSPQAIEHVARKLFSSTFTDTEARSIAERLNGLVKTIDAINDNRPPGTDSIQYEYAIERLEQRYRDPLHALEMLRQRYPQASYREFIEYTIEPFKPNGGISGLITPEQQQRYDALHDKFEGICERATIMNIKDATDIEALENLDPDNLRAALDRIYDESRSDEAAPPDRDLRASFIHILRNTLIAQPEELNNFITNFRNVPDDVFAAFLAYSRHDELYGNLARQLCNADGQTAEDHQKRLQSIKHAIQNGILEFIESPSSLENYLKFRLTRELLGSPDGQRLAPLLKTGQEILGSFLTIDSLELLADVMYAETVPEELMNLGVTKPGEAGINQLKHFLNTFTQSIFETGNIPVGLLVRHPFLANYVKSIVRYETSQFGSHDNQEFLALLTTSERGNFHVGPEFYVGEAAIKVKDSEALAEFAITQDAVDEWRAYARTLQAAQEIVPPSGPVAWDKFGDVLKMIQQDILSRGMIMSGGIEKLQQKIDQFTQANKDTGKLQTQLDQQQATFDQLSEIDFHNVEDFDIVALCQTIQTLATHNSIAKQGNLQTLLVATALLKNRYDEHVPPAIDTNTEMPNLEQVGEMANLIGHLTNQEVWGPLFNEIGGEKQLNSILSIDALNATIERSLSVETKGQRTMQFLPTRGALMELSGHIADACWASKYESLAAAHPNTTAMIFIQNPGTAARRMAGAAFLIETTSADGLPLLVIRGLNPLENIINDLDPKSFLDEFSTYARAIAEDQGRSLAIVIDDHSGGSSTNRPTLFAYLSELKAELPQVRLASTLDTTINGYNIVNDTYLI